MYSTDASGLLRVCSGSGRDSAPVAFAPEFEVVNGRYVAADGLPQQILLGGITSFIANH